jgi:uncharacterized membrane protein HdeD (DUF308 family)
MLSLVLKALLWLTAAFLLVWAIAAVSVARGIRRLQRSTGSRGPVTGLLHLSFGLAINIVVAGAALLWYKLRGKPAPPFPPVGPQ